MWARRGSAAPFQVITNPNLNIRTSAFYPPCSFTQYFSTSEISENGVVLMPFILEVVAYIA